MSGTKYQESIGVKMDDNINISLAHLAAYEYNTRKILEEKNFQKSNNNGDKIPNNKSNRQLSNNDLIDFYLTKF